MPGVQRITPALVEVLSALLDENEGVWGLRLTQLTGLKPGTIYPLLERLEESELVTGEWETDTQRSGPRRRYYVLSERGRETAQNLISARAKRRLRLPGRESERFA